MKKYPIVFFWLIILELWSCTGRRYNYLPQLGFSTKQGTASTNELVHLLPAQLQLLNLGNSNLDNNIRETQSDWSIIGTEAVDSKFQPPNQQKNINATHDVVIPIKQKRLRQVIHKRNRTMNQVDLFSPQKPQLSDAAIWVIVILMIAFMTLLVYSFLGGGCAVLMALLLILSVLIMVLKN